MMLQIGLMRKAKRLILNRPLSNWGFTLLELLIVSVIILALVSFSTPLFRKTFTDLELKETASDISKFISLAQERAIVERRIYKISFNFENNTYRLFGVSGEGENIIYTSPRDRFGRVFYIPKSISSDVRTADIFFYPDGHSDIVELNLLSRNEKRLRITTTGILGNVVIEEK